MRIKRYKKKSALFFALLLIVSVFGNAFASGESVLFTDSLGRTVECSKEVDRVAVTGQMAQIMLFALCPDKLAGIADPWDAGAADTIGPKYLDLPVLGQLYGGKGEANLETLILSGADIVIDIGEPKGSIGEDLDALGEQTGIPFIHITADVRSFGEAFRKLGELVGMREEAETLASYCERVYSETCALAENASKVRMLYIPGEDGLSVIAKDSYHSGIIDLIADNAAVVDAPSAKGTGNAVDFEQLLIWDPEVIVFAPDTVYGTVGMDPLWQSLSAISNGRYYEVPETPYNWLGFPPSVQCVLGMQWLTRLLYPEAMQDVDVNAVVKEFYSLFFHSELSDEQVSAFLERSVGKVQ